MRRDVVNNRGKRHYVSYTILAPAHAMVSAPAEIMIEKFRLCSYMIFSYFIFGINFFLSL